jgi:predicted transcriptional regulator
MQKKAALVSVRVSNQTILVIDQLARAEGLTRSEFWREAIAQFIRQKQKSKSRKLVARCNINN